MRRRRRSNDFLVGALTLVAIACLTWLGFAKHLPWRHEYRIHAVFASANELHANSPVRIAGVDVGRVRDVQKGPGSTALVTMAIRDSGRPIHSDATMKIRPRIFLEGNFFVDLRPGTGAAPEVKAGGTIPLSQTATPVQLDQILSTLNSSTRDELKTLLRELGTALGHGGAAGLRAGLPAWEGAFKGTAITAEAFRGERPHDLSAFIAAQARVSTVLARHDRQLADLVTNFNRTVAALADRHADVSASLRGLAGVTRSAPAALDAINAATPAVRGFIADVRPALREAPRTLDLALPVLRQLDALLAPSQLPALVADLRPAVRLLVRIEPRLVSLFDLVRPVSDCVRVHGLPTLNAKLDDGDLSTGQPAWAELLHGMVGLASASQNFDGNGPAVRYHGGYGDQLISTGRVPQGGQLFGLSSEPLIGSRPPWPGAGNQPPFRPDVPCATQQLPDLRAGMSPVPAARRGRPARLDPATLRRLAARLRRARRPATRARASGTLRTGGGR